MLMNISKIDILTKKIVNKKIDTFEIYDVDVTNMRIMKKLKQ